VFREAHAFHFASEKPPAPHLSIVDGQGGPMHSTSRFSRRRPKAQLSPEILEDRCLMTGGAGSIIAVESATIGTAGSSNTAPFVINPAQFTLPKGHMTIGIDVVPQSGSTVQPLITQLNEQIGNRTIHIPITRTPGSPAVLGTLSLSRTNPKAPANFSVVITGEHKTTGAYLLGFYLPGDANADGIVNQTDIAQITALIGATKTSSNYNVSADTNRDGKITRSDVSWANKDLGVQTT
jgi:hypothetical protein